MFCHIVVFVKREAVYNYAANREARMRHRTWVLTSLVTIILILAVLPLSGCRSLMNLAGGAPPSVDAVVMCRDVDSEGAPIDPATTFNTDTPEIFCSVKVSNAPANSRARVDWIYREGELEGVSNYIIDTATVTTEGTGYVSFSLSIPDAGWPEGLYELVLYMDDKKMETVRFSVSGSGPTQTPTPQPQDPAPTNPPDPTGATITEVTMTRDVNPDYTPLDPTSLFEEGTPTVYTTMFVSNAPEQGVLIRAEWFDTASASPVPIDSYETELGNGYAYFYYSMPGGWLAGEYAIKLYVDGDLQATVPYSVVAGGLQVSEATMALDVDSQNRPVNPTTVFPTNSDHIYCSVLINARPSSTHAQFDWYYLHGPDLPYTNQLFASGEITLDEEAGYTWFRMNHPEGGFPRGEYAFLLYLDGNEEVYLEFTVQ